MPTIEIHRLRIDRANVARLQQLRGAAIRELRDQIPELWQADLVRLDDDVWLDIRTWSSPVDPARLAHAEQRTTAIGEFESLITARLGHHSGERIHTTGTLAMTAAGVRSGRRAGSPPRPQRCTTSWRAAAVGSRFGLLRTVFSQR